MSMHAGTQARQLGPLSFYGLSVVVGIVGALGAVVFRGLIALFHNLFFLGQWSFLYDANVHTPAKPLGPLRHPGARAGRRRRRLPRQQLSPQRPKGMACPRSWMRSITTRE